MRAPAQASQEQPVVVEFGWGHTGAFEAIKRSIEQRTSVMDGVGEPGPVLVEEQDPRAAAPEQGGPPSLLSWKWSFRGRARKLAERDMNEDESIQFVIVGDWWQSIVALEERLLVVKPGFMAGATFGGRSTSFHYRDITGVEVNTGLLTAVIEINTPSYQGTQDKDFWRINNPDRDPFSVSNCIPIQKADLKRFKPHLDRLRTKIREAKQERPAPLPQNNNLGSELERLASLRASGALTDEEFQQAKKRLLE